MFQRELVLLISALSANARWKRREDGWTDCEELEAEHRHHHDPDLCQARVIVETSRRAEAFDRKEQKHQRVKLAETRKG